MKFMSQVSTIPPFIDNEIIRFIDMGYSVNHITNQIQAMCVLYLDSKPTQALHSLNAMPLDTTNKTTNQHHNQGH